MTSGARGTGDLPLRIALIASSITALVAFVVAVGRWPTTQSAGSVALSDTPIAAAGMPIAAEAQVFRTRAGMLAIEPAADRRRSAHPRTLETFRALRAFPGAPPRIPHGFTTDEFRTGACKTCHERGGYSPRFGAYVPLTPHPEMGACLQCHVGNDDVTGVTLPSADPNARCRQCHRSGGVPDPSAGLDWRTTEWPRLAARLPDRPPPEISHDLEFRGNCLTCHAGPAAVVEIRTRHPERANCRQCHLTAATDAGDFARPAPSDRLPEGGP